MSRISGCKELYSCLCSSSCVLFAVAYNGTTGSRPILTGLPILGARLRAVRQRGWISNPDRVQRFSSPRRPDRLWGAHSLLSNGTGASFPGGGKSGRGVKLTTRLQLLSRSRKCGYIHSLPISLHGAVLS
jgi:hypothetical protein